MSELTLAPLASLIDRPGLSFYVAYAHVEDVSAHLMSIKSSISRRGNEDPYGLATLTSCILSSQEMLLGLLYRAEICDLRAGVDKFALGLAVSDILSSFKSVLDVAAALDGENNHGNKEDKERIITREDSTEAADKIIPTSFFHKLAKAESLGLISSGTKEALLSSLQIMKDKSPTNRCAILDSKTREALVQLNASLGGDNTFSILRNACKENYSYVALKVPSLVLKSHENRDGGVDPSSHGPEDYIFQITHVILEHFFWYIENVLSALSSGEEE